MSMPAVARRLFRTAFLGTQVALAEWFITSASPPRGDWICIPETGPVAMAAMTFFSTVGAGVGICSLARNQPCARFSKRRWASSFCVGGACKALTGVITATMALASVICRRRPGQLPRLHLRPQRPGGSVWSSSGINGHQDGRQCAGWEALTVGGQPGADRVFI